MSSSIGIFDSGLGGLSVWQHIKAVLPAESLSYVADSLHAPYGERDEGFIRQRSLAIGEFLEQQGAKAIVVACNTATAASVELLREKLSCPVVAMEPALKPAVLNTRSGKVGILATSSTLASRQYQSLVERFASGVECIAQPASGLVEFVEQGLLNDPRMHELLKTYLEPMLEKGVDSVVLGCTHYPFLIEPIREITGAGVEVIDTGRAVAEQLYRVLESHQLLAEGSVANDLFFSSGEPVTAQQHIYNLLGIDAAVQKLPV